MNIMKTVIYNYSKTSESGMKIHLYHNIIVNNIDTTKPKVLSVYN